MSEGQALSGRVALVTGVSRRIGIGAAIVKRFLDDGASVFATGWAPHDAEMPAGADPGGEEALIAELNSGPERFHYEAIDLEDPNAPERLVASTIERFGTIDIVVANHARSCSQTLREVTAEELDKSWAVNTRASVLLAKSLLQLRPPGPNGRLILFTSGQHLSPMRGEIPYVVSKGAIHQATASLADSMAEAGITVNCVNPGPVDTGYLFGDVHREVANRFPSGKWRQPSDVARLIAWLASDESEWITGQVIDSEGGYRR